MSRFLFYLTVQFIQSNGIETGIVPPVSVTKWVNLWLLLSVVGLVGSERQMKGNKTHLFFLSFL
jgi:hypothetical protein